MEGYRLKIATVQATYFFSPAEIVRLEAKNNYTRIYFTDRPPFLATVVLKSYQKLLEPYGFVRTHRSHLVNKQYVLFVDKGDEITMKDLSKAGISKRKKTTAIKALSN
jgi:two-component system LytT family response regulator